MRTNILLLLLGAVSCYAPDIKDKGFACKIGDPMGCPEGFACTTCPDQNNPPQFDGCCSNHPVQSAAIDAAAISPADEDTALPVSVDGPLQSTLDSATDSTQVPDGCATLCSGICIDEQRDVKNCGSCGKDCRTGAPTMASVRCAAGMCQFDCGTGKHVCSGVCLDNDADHCGPSCTPCNPTPHGVTWCDGTACVLQCITGYVASGGVCVPI